MRRISALLLTASSLAIASASLATAADLRVAPIPAAPVPAWYGYNWTGFFVGGHVGGEWSHKEWTEIVGTTQGARLRLDPDGMVAGGQVGFDYQIRSLVLGVEASWSWTNGEAQTGCFANVAFSCGVELDWLATLTGRLGWAVDRALFYVKGGGAWVRETYGLNVGGPAPIGLSQDRTGWLFGLGFEYAFAPNWSAKVEWNYINFGTDQILFAPGLVHEVAQDVNILKGAVNYRFGWPGPVTASY